NECAKLLASVGVKKVVYLSDKHQGLESNRMAKKIFELANIEHERLVPSPKLLDSLNQHFLDLTEML
ncbi:MAG: hypothetical protein KC478_00790, partial [Bacteriovoracaceae bacterium]|nr:hypothetical protein [Bacteriovoracaceae bacterium]